MNLIGSSLVFGQTNPISADEIDTWNGTMFRAAQTAGTSPFVMTRVAAIVQVAVFEAVNGIERRYTPVHVAPDAEPGASQRAAAMLAAYTTLVNLYARRNSDDWQIVLLVACCSRRSLAWNLTKDEVA